MTEQDNQNIQIARLLYSGDKTERANIAQEIIWHVPGHNPVSGDYHGFEAYTQLMVSRMAPVTRWDFQLEGIMVNGNHLMTSFRVQGEPKGKSVDLRGGHLLRISGGKVVEGWGFTNDQDALDDFFSA